MALLVIKRPQAAVFAVFGTFAHLVTVDYDRDAGARFAEAAMLTLLGAFMVSLGAVASAYVWFAVGGAVVVGCLMEVPISADCRIAVIRAALLLAFMLAVAAPVPARSVLPYLTGWLLAGIMAQPALLLIWGSARGARVYGAKHQSIARRLRGARQALSYAANARRPAGGGEDDRHVSSHSRTRPKNVCFSRSGAPTADARLSAKNGQERPVPRHTSLPSPGRDVIQ